MNKIKLFTLMFGLSLGLSAQEAPTPIEAQAFNCQFPQLEDCNYCAVDVKNQFSLFKAGQRQSEGSTDQKWYFNWSDRMPPSNMKTTNLDLRRHLKTHVQGFVRTNHPLYTYAGTHSHRDGKGKGFIFIIDQVEGRSSGNKRLRALHPALTDHPNGMSAIGNFVLYSEDTQVRLLDLDQTLNKQDIGFDPPEMDGIGGGGISMVKLASGDHLLITGSGGTITNPKPRYTYFWNVKSAGLKSNFDVRFVNQYEYSQPAHWKNDYRSSENISVVTECGTNKIYTVHTTGDENIGNSKGYWRLSELKFEDGQYQLETLDAFNMDQNLTKCHIRSAATVWTGADNVVRFICHARHTIKGPFEGKENMMFQVRVPKF